MSDKTTVDLSGAKLCINGEEHHVVSGDIVVESHHLHGPHGQPRAGLSQDITIDVSTWQPPKDDTAEFTDRDVYAVYEHTHAGRDRLVTIFEDDATTLSEFIDYADTLASGDSQICTGEFHAAEPDNEYLSVGDWYLKKAHGVGISHTLLEGCMPADDTIQAVRNALADLETAADRVESDFDAEAIRQSVATLREELGVADD